MACRRPALAVTLAAAFLLVAASSALAAPATYFATETIPVPPASTFSGSAGGDGWAVALSSTEVFNVFHHQDTLQVACHLQTNAQQCWPTESETITDANNDNFATSGRPALYFDQSTGHLYVMGTRTSDNTGGLVCIDTTQAPTNSDPFCGFTPLSAVGDAPDVGLSNLSALMHVGQRLYSFNYVNGGAPGGGSGTENELLCFDLSTDAACSGQPYAVNIGSGTANTNTFPEPAAVAIGSELIIPMTIGSTDELACWDTGTNSDCTGSWPVTNNVAGYPGNGGAPFPLLDSSGQTTGFCLPAGGTPCFNLDGSSAPTPNGMSAAIDASSGWNGPAVVIGPRVYVPNTSTYDSVNNRYGGVDCWDYAANNGAGGTCANFPVSFNNLNTLYTVNQDPQRPTCLWINSDSGTEQIQNVDAFTGGPCGQGAIRVLASQFVAPAPQCAPASYTSVQVVSPDPSQYSSGTMQFDDADGNPIAGIGPNALDSTGTVNLTGLNLNTATGLPQFLVTLNDTSGTPGAVVVRLTWVGDYAAGCLGGGVTLAAPPPSNSAAPAVSGTPQEGSTLTARPGTWSGSDPLSYGYRWQRCSGATCSVIAGATRPTYTLTTADVGSRIDVVVTATNSPDAGGASATATSGATKAVLPQPPASTAAPSISGTLTVGQTLTEHHGRWSNNPTSYAYQWRVCDATGTSCRAISGAAARTYVVTASEIGKTIRVQETAANAGGPGAAAVSPPSSVIDGLSISGSEPPSKSNGSYNPGVRVSCPSGSAECTGTATVTAGVPARPGSTGKVRDRQVAVARGPFTVPAGGSVAAAFTLNPLGRLLLSDHKQLKVRVTVTAQAPGGEQVTTTKTVMLSGTLARYRVFGVQFHRDGTASLHVRVTAPGRVMVLTTAWNYNIASNVDNDGDGDAQFDTLLQPANGRFVVGRASVTATRPGVLTLHVTPTAQGAQLMAHHAYEPTFRLWVSYVPAYAAQQNVGFYNLHVGRYPSLPRPVMR